MLAQTTYDGPAQATPCLIAHGLFGSARNWGVIAKRMSETRRVLTVDMRNHGHSPHTDTHSYPDLAADLAEVIEAHGGPIDVIGHSMGGKAAMVLALHRPDLVRRLIVGDIAPVAYARSYDEQISAMKSLDLKQMSRRSEAAAALGAAGIAPELQSFLTQSLDLAEQRWRYNLGTLSAEMPKIMGFPDETGQFGGPVLFLSGAASDYVTAETRPRIKSLFPAARFARLTGAGHWLHADKPREFLAAALTFLDAKTSS